MSTILDSLKKSSDQRNDGDKNAIDNFNFSDHKNNKFSGLLVALVLLALTAALLYWGYSYLKTDETENTAIAEKLVPTTVPEADTTNIDRRKASAQGLKDNSSRIQKPDSQKVKDKMKSIQMDKKKQSIADLNKANSAKNNTVQKTANKPENKTQDSVKKTIQKSVQKTVQKSEIKKPQKPSQKKQAVKTNYPYVYQLPFSIRKEIPKLKLNIHVYDPLVENRVAVINGEWYAVGNLIEDTILVKDIVQNGVLLEFSGKVFLIPNL